MVVSSLEGGGVLVVRLSFFVSWLLGVDPDSLAVPRVYEFSHFVERSVLKALTARKMLYHEIL